MFPVSLEENLTLHLLDASDATELLTVLDENRLWLRRFLGWLDNSTEVANTEDFIARSLKQYEQALGFQLGIRANDQLVGIIGLQDLSTLNRSIRIGYWLAESATGQGFMTRACRWAINYAIDSLNVHRIEIRASPRNVASAAIPKRLGFTLEGTQRDAEWLYDHFEDLQIFGMLAPEWSTIDS